MVINSEVGNRNAEHTNSIDHFLDEGKLKMIALCESFHVLVGKPGVSPWNQHEFARGVRSGAYTSASRQAAAFVLAVWNGSCAGKDTPWFTKRPYSVPVFDVVVAIALWDELNRSAFLAWCENPFYP